MKTIFIVEFTTSTKNINERWLSNYYFKSRELAKQYAEDFIKDYSIEKISFKIKVFCPHNYGR